MMPVAEMKALLSRRGREVEACLARCCEGRAVPPRLRDSMLYSLQAGGKRLRPALCLSCAALCGLETAEVLYFASAIEMIHTYSLVHDDLPAMDNDDLRRGKPSSHKAFGEATAILAGDGLLTDAFTFMASCGRALPADRVLAAVVYLARAAGSPGMVGGQYLDMLYTEQKRCTLDELRAMHAMKTGALIRASCVCGALLAGADPAAVQQAEAYGAALGAAFQIVDDILDVTGDEALLGKPVGSDAAEGKVTYPSLLGLAAARALAAEEAERARAALAPFGEKAAFLRGLADYVVKRVQ